MASTTAKAKRVSPAELAPAQRAEYERLKKLAIANRHLEGPPLPSEPVPFNSELRAFIAQLKAASQEESAHGTLASTISADLTITATDGSTSPKIILKNACLMDNGLVFDANDLRVGEATWETTRGFSSGVPAIVTSVA